MTQITQQSPYIPPPFPICMKCGQKMRHNVPRMGDDGGFIHDTTNELLCEPEDVAGHQWAIAEALRSAHPPLKWSIEKPTVAKGKMQRFWCATKNIRGGVSHCLLCYGNAYLMPLSDSCDNPSDNAVPVGDEGDYEWTGWWEESCEQCDTYWEFNGEVITWMELPKYAPIPPPAEDKTEGATS